MVMKPCVKSCIVRAKKEEGKHMDQEIEKAVQELINRLDGKGFFEKYCTLVCPRAEEGICEKCPFTKRDIMEFWASREEVKEMVHHSEL